MVAAAGLRYAPPLRPANVTPETRGINDEIAGHIEKAGRGSWRSVDRETRGQRDA